MREKMDVLSLTTESQLNSFISDQLQPNATYLANCAEVVDRLVKFLQNNVPDKLRPRRVIKGGSLGKGTMVIGKADVDITLMLARYVQVRDLVRDMEGLLTLLERYLSSYHGVRIIDRNPFCIQIEVTCHGGHTHDADILLAVDILDIESNRDRIYEKMGGPDRDIVTYYSASFVPLMIDMFSRLPTKLKSLIRLVKAWKVQEMTNEAIKWPKSYGFEMVTVYAWIQAGQPVNFNMKRALHAVLTYLVNHRNFRADFGHFIYYSRRFLRPPQHEPYIMDPLDPYDNLYSRKNWDWDQTASKARAWLQKPLFRDIAYSTTNQW